MSKLPREAEPGTEFVYKTGETNLIGEIVMAATKKPLATYLSEKIWSKVGMEHDAYWMTSADGNEIGGCCLSISLRDYGRYALFFLRGAKSVVASDWARQATTASPFRQVGGIPSMVELVSAAATAINGGLDRATRFSRQVSSDSTSSSSRPRN